MKTIKLRVWHKNNFYHFSIGEHWTKKQLNLYNDFCLLELKFDIGTGIYDRNNIEIFESDIIYDGCMEDNFTILFGEFTNSNTNKSGFYFSDNKPFGKSARETTYRIIGNIHENPDLLT